MRHGESQFGVIVWNKGLLEPHDSLQNRVLVLARGLAKSCPKVVVTGAPRVISAWSTILGLDFLGILWQGGVSASLRLRPVLTKLGQ